MPDIIEPPPEIEPNDLEEDHEAFAAEETQDPWTDPLQTDWPNEEVA